MAATLDELARRGMRAMTIESVAERAGVSKVTIYRWWPDKVALTLEALRELPELAVPDTGTLERDLRALRTRLVGLIETTRLGDVLPALVAERHHSEHRVEIGRYIAERSEPFRAIVRRAIGRGELPAGVDPDLAARLFASPLGNSLLLRDRPLDDDEWTFAIRVVASGLRTERHAR